MSTAGQVRAMGQWFRDGEAWIVGLHGSRTPMRASKGLTHLGHLLSSPGSELSALDLVAAVEGHGTGTSEAPDGLSASGGLGDAGVALDAEAKAAYKARLAEAQQELDEAERFHDPHRAERARAEIDFIAHELSAAVGLGGRDRRSGSALERARVNVTRAIKTAVDRIAPHDEALAAHLRATIKTGAFCSYAPHSVEQIEWDFTGTRTEAIRDAPRPGSAVTPADTRSSLRSDRAEPARPPRIASLRARGGLVEREAELAQIEEALGLAADGCGDLIVLDGPPGIGKSALLAATAELAGEQGFNVLRARGSERESAFSFGIARQVFDTQLRDLSAGERDDLLRGAVRPAAGLLGYAEPADSDEPVTAQPSDTFPILNGLYWLTVGIARSQPLALVIDDVHWADSTSAAWLTFTAARLIDWPILVILGARPLGDEAAAELGDLLDSGDAGVIELAPLSPAAVASVVRSAWPAADHSFCVACHAASRGNPFYLHELLAAARASGLSPDAAGAKRLRGVTPDSVARLVGRRLREVPASARQLAYACAVFGGSAELPVAAVLAEIGDDEALESADALADKGIVQNVRPLEFTHPLIHAAVSADVPLSTRTIMHERAATILADHGASPSEVAAHLVHTRPSGRMETVACLREAARAAGNHGSPSEAALLLERALGEPPSSADLPSVLLELARARNELGEHASAKECLARALHLDLDPRLRAEIALESCQAYDHGDFAFRLELLDDAIPSVADLDPELRFKLEAKAVEVLAAEAFASASPAMRRAHRDRLARLVELVQGDLPVERELRAVYTVHGVLTGEIAADEAQATVVQALDNGVLMRRLAAGGWSADAAVEVLSMVDAFDLADRHAREAERTARELGTVVAQGWACMLRSFIALRRGALLEADALLRSVYALTRQTPSPYVDDVANQVRAWLAIERNDLEGADEACEELEQAGSAPLGIPWARGRLHAARGEHDLAVTSLYAALETLRAADRWRGTLGSPRIDLVLSLTAMGSRDEALSHAEEELAAARRFGAASAVGTALVAMGHATAGRQGLAYFAEAAAVLAPSQAVLARAVALHDLGAAQTAEAETEHGVKHLRHALDLALRCGALRLHERARSALLAAGEQTVPLAPVGAALLSASELRIAELAAEGASDLEIAQALFVSVQAVERQISMVLAKLGISDRSGLAGALGTTAS